MASCGIQAEFTLILVLRMNVLKELMLQSMKNMLIFIKAMNERTITLESLSTDTTVKTVKMMINDKLGDVYTVDQGLMFAGKLLRDEFTLADYNVQKEFTLYILLGTHVKNAKVHNVDEVRDKVTLLEQCFEIFVKTLTGKMLILKTEPLDTVETVKTKIQGKKSIFIPSSNTGVCWKTTE